MAMRGSCLVIAVWVSCVCDVAQAGKIYWAEFETQRIRRANLDGTDIETIVTTQGGSPYNVAVDPTRRILYWTTNEEVDDTPFDSIWRARLDGSEVELLAQEIGRSTSDVTVDVGNGRVYWAKGWISGDIQFAAPRILVADVNQTAFSILYSAGCKPTGVTVGTVSHSIYWSDSGRCGFNGEVPPRLWHATSDGALREVILSGPTSFMRNATGIAVDEYSGHLYWTDWSLGIVARSSLDGVTFTQAIATVEVPEDIVWDFDSDSLYWSDSEAGTITRSSTDGSNAVTIVSVGTTGLGGIAILNSGVPVPTVSSWGLVVTALALLVAGTAIVRLVPRADCCSHEGR
jgi:sugar lactone lactonase YvrE